MRMAVLRKPLISPGAYLKIIDFSEDYCKLMKFTTNPLFKIYDETLNLTPTNIPFKCPIKKVITVVDVFAIR